ncbi:antibiotic biosynthesis monooxygenase [Kocuria rhizophila]|nr:antibiotic biosynthesis monooxygenase [Kocuria rhizophila]
MSGPVTVRRRRREDTPWLSSAAPPGPPSPARRRPCAPRLPSSAPSPRGARQSLLQACQSPEEPAVFRIFKVYQDKAAFKAHVGSGASQFGVGQAIPALAKRQDNV